MKKTKKIILALQVLIFLVLVVVLGIINMAKFADFKINDRVDYNEWTADLGDKLETDIGTTFYEKFQMVTLNGAMRTALSQKYMNNVYKLNNGYLAEVHTRQTDEAMQALADNIAGVHRFLSEQGIPMLFVMAPFSIGKYDPQLPAGVEDFTNDNADRFMQALRDRGVTTIDLRDTMHEDGVNHYDMMYRTDHHWNTHAGFYAYQKMEPWFTDTLGWLMDPKIGNINNYTLQTWPEWHLGKYGQRTGSAYGGVDDFTLYIPNFATNVQHFGEDISGSVQDIFYNMEALQSRDYTSRLTYDDVLGGGDLYGEIYLNHNPISDKKLLLISNSFYRAVYPYLLMQFREVRYIHTSISPGLNKDHMLSNGYDAVVMLYEPTIVTEGSGAFRYEGY